jgi:spore germination cell wall hydrolase CwlJ-like protein
MLTSLLLSRNLETPVNVQALNNEITCLAKTIYFESRNQPQEGQIAVAEVVLARVKSNKFPNTICGVIKQPSQFSWYQANKKLEMKNKKAKNKAYEIAIKVITRTYTPEVPTALFYHNDSVKPAWAKKLVVVKTIKNHTFYNYVN